MLQHVEQSATGDGCNDFLEAYAALTFQQGILHFVPSKILHHQNLCQCVPIVIRTRMLGGTARKPGRRWRNGSA